MLGIKCLTASSVFIMNRIPGKQACYFFRWHLTDALFNFLNHQSFNMKKLPLHLSTLFFLSLLLWSCGEEVKQFSENEPYGIELARVRSYYHAQNIENRLKEMGIPTYMISLRDEIDESNEWYILMTGAAKDTVAISQLKVELDIKHKLGETKVLNYSQVDEFLTKIESKEIKEVEKIAAEKPDIPDNVYDLMEKFPKNNLFNVENVSLHNFPAKPIARKHLSSFYDAKLDLPRGVKKSIVAKNASSYAEVIFKDNLYGDQVTIDVLKLKSGHDLGQQPRARLIQYKTEELPEIADNIAWYFACLILNTGRYRTEEYEKISVSSFIELYGYKVLIEPRKDYFRTYMILVDASGEFVIFSQSTDKTDVEILAYLEDFGKSRGMLEYSEFHNTFFTIPKCLDDDDIFLGFTSSVLDQSYARSKNYANWAKAMVGHTESSAHFYNTELKKGWVCAAFDLLTPDKKDYIYGDMYTNTKAPGKYPIKVQDRDGFFVEVYWSNEVNFSTNARHVMAIAGFQMSKESLLERAEKFQTGVNSKDKDPCDDQPETEI